MKTRFILFRRGGVFYSQDTENGKQVSLRTKEKAEAFTLLHARNEAFRQPFLNLHIARTYLSATDPEIAKRTWQVPMDEMTRTKTGPTFVRNKRAMQDPAFDSIRNLPILETKSTDFLRALEAGTVATNVFLRRKQAQRGSEGGNPDASAAAKPIVSRSPFDPVSDTKSYWTGEGVLGRSPFKAERVEEDLRNQTRAATGQSEEAKRLHEAALATKDRSAAQGDKAGSPGGDTRDPERDQPWRGNPTVQATETKNYWTGKGRVGASPFSDERLQDDAERRREEERRRREEEEEKRRQAAKAPVQSNSAQSNSQSHSHSHSHSH